MIKNGMRPIHPGEILREEFMIPLGLSANDIVRQWRGISGDTALRLARHFHTDAHPWLHLQSAYELRRAEITASKAIARQVKPRVA